MSFDPKNLVLYPQDPGVYLMKDAKGTILYIGKAKNIRSRLKQYFSVSGDSREMIPYLISQIESIDTIIALTDKDALILENTLIKKHKPKYNVLLKDDKTFISLIMTQHKWPMLKLIRYKGKPKEPGTYFGPFTNAIAARQTYDLISKLFPLRQCSDNELNNRVRPCLLYDIKRCIAPCCNLCSESEYDNHVQRTISILKGKDKELLKELQLQMQKAADDLQFEKANELKNLLEQIQSSTDPQLLDNPFAKDCDSLGIYREADSIFITKLIFRDGKLTGSEHFSFHLIASTNQEVISTFLLQHYKNLPSLPKEILLPIFIEETETLEELINEISPHKISIQTPQKGRKQDLVEMAIKNAKALFIRDVDAKSRQEKILLDLCESLQLHRYPKKIECIDTSNISGSDPVASLVCYIDGELNKAKSKVFKIKSQIQADDYTAMKEVIYRHFIKAKENNDFCDLFIVDGGKGQLNLALKILEELSIASIDVIAITKENARHDKGLTEEKIYLPHTLNPIAIDPRSNLMFFLQKIRDAAHKKAIEFHRKKRKQRLLSSELDTIDGIGPVKKRRLLLKFGSVKAIKAASKQELEKVQGLTSKDIDQILSISRHPNNPSLES